MKLTISSLIYCFLICIFFQTIANVIDYLLGINYHVVDSLGFDYGQASSLIKLAHEQIWFIGGGITFLLINLLTVNEK